MHDPVIASVILLQLCLQIPVVLQFQHGSSGFQTQLPGDLIIVPKESGFPLLIDTHIRVGFHPHVAVLPQINESLCANEPVLVSLRRIASRFVDWVFLQNLVDRLGPSLCQAILVIIPFQMLVQTDHLMSLFQIAAFLPVEVVVHQRDLETDVFLQTHISLLINGFLKTFPTENSPSSAKTNRFFQTVALSH
jgi:hypothetical protein